MMSRRGPRGARKNIAQKDQNMKEDQKQDLQKIEPDMVVEATKGDLGEEDVSKPKVTSIAKDQNGNIEKVVVSKGVVFKKKIDIPADRIQSVDQNVASDKSPGKVKIETEKGELAALTATGEEELASEDQDSLLDTVQQEI